MTLIHDCGGNVIALPDTYGQGKMRVEFVCEKCDKIIGHLDDCHALDLVAIAHGHAPVSGEAHAAT